uniref:UDP-N-acetylmuramoylalanyl-D-glutamate-2-6-diaminopimelate ligase n=1 Tax=Lotharella vacuolata TaxID=74820 RepID=A0A0H5BL19_9EUKA|nr:UDP-N-acetylmuramoylalanyl-D-glutamate-2-6-diaminopimelate ligase [Lotharella vacuolata]
MRFYKISSNIININNLKIIKTLFHSKLIYKRKTKKIYIKKKYNNLDKLSLNKALVISSCKEMCSYFMIKKRYYDFFKNMTNSIFNNSSIKNIESLLAINLMIYEKNINLVFNSQKLKNCNVSHSNMNNLGINYFFINKLLLENSYYKNYLLKKNKIFFSIFLTGCSGKTSVGFLLANLMIGLSFNFSTYTDYFIINNEFIFNICDKKFIDRLILDERLDLFPNIKKKYLITLSDINQFEFLPLIKDINKIKSTMALIELSSFKFNHRKFTSLTADVILFNNFSNYKSNNNMNKNSVSFKQIASRFLIKKKTLAIVDGEDQFSERHFFHNNNNFLIVYSSFDENSDIYTTEIRYSTWGTQLTLVSPAEKKTLLTINLVSKHNIRNILCVFSFGFIINIPINYIVLSMERIGSIPNRMQNLDLGTSFNLIVDYSETTEGISGIINSISENYTEKPYLVYGSSGNLDGIQNKRSVNILSKLTKKMFITTVNPRWINTNRLLYEAVQGIPTDILKYRAGSVYDWTFDFEKIPIWFQVWLYYYQNHSNLYTSHDRSLVIRICFAMLQENDIMIISGRGCNGIFEKITTDGKKIKYYYNDVEEIYRILNYVSILRRANPETQTLPWNPK